MKKLAILAVFLTHFTPASSARAGLVIETQDVQVIPGQGGSFDLLLTDTGSVSYNVAGDSIAASAPTGVMFTDVTIGTTTAPYIFMTSGTTQGGGPFLTSTNTPSGPFTYFIASDSEFASPGYRTINPGDIYGLAHITFTSDSTAAPGPLVLQFDTSNTSFSDNSGNTIPYSISAVPEPSTLTLAGIGAGFGAFVGIRARRRTSSLPPVAD